MTTPPPERRTLGGGLDVFPIALGCMGMSGAYGPADERESIATIHAALDRGITLVDTGDHYAAGHNELLIARALKDRPGAAQLSVKFGALRGPDGGWLGIDLRPERAIPLDVVAGTRYDPHQMAALDSER